MEKAFTFIDKHLDQFINDLQQVCRQPSISAQNIGIRECADIIVEKFKSLGMSVKIWETEGNPVIFAEMKGNSDKTILFYNHYDVQPPEPIEKWTHEPFGAEVEDGIIFCRGVADNKGPLYSRIHALETLIKTYGSSPVNVKFIVDGEEESGSPNLKPCIDAHREELKADLCIWENSYRDLEGRTDARLGNKGMVYLELKADTSKIDFHSGYAPVVPNAAWRLVWALSTLKDKDERILIDGFYDDVRPALPEEFKILQELPSMEEELKVRTGNNTLAGNVTGSEVTRRLLAEPSCNIAGIKSGYTLEGSKTVLPGKAFAKLDFRLVADQDPVKIQALLRTHLDKHGFSDIQIETKEKDLRPSKTPVTTPYLKLYKQAVSMVTDKQVRVFPTSPGSGPRYVFSDWTDMPMISSGTGNAFSQQHAPDENITLDDYTEETRIMAALMFSMKDFDGSSLEDQGNA